MRKTTTLGISLVALLGIAGTAAADHNYDGDCDDDDGYVSSDGAAYNYDDNYYDDNYDYAANGWITPTVELPVVKTVVVKPRAGYVWVEGNWTWNGYDWQWNDGYWLRARSSSSWVQGSWQSHAGYRRWVPGRWQSRRVVVTTNNGHRWNGNGHRWNNNHRDRNNRWNDRRGDNRRGNGRWGNGHGRGRRGGR